MDFSSAIEKEIGHIDFDLVMPDPSRKKEKRFLRTYTADGLYEIVTRVNLESTSKASGSPISGWRSMSTIPMSIT